MLKRWIKHYVTSCYRTWAGPDPLARPDSALFHSLSKIWRSSRRLYRYSKRQPPILLALDGTPQLKGYGSFTGWVISRDAPIRTVEAWVGNRLLATTIPDTLRPDVEILFPWYRKEPLLGFRFCPVPGILPDGEHTLRVIAYDYSGRSVSLVCTLIVDRFSCQDSNLLPTYLTGSNREYQHWLSQHDRHVLPTVSDGPNFSIVVPVYRPRLEQLNYAIQSVFAQTYSRWELILSNDGNDCSTLTNHLQNWRHQDSRIRTVQCRVNQGISIATNRAILASSGDYLAFLDQDDLLHPQALQAVANAHQEHSADLYYTDEDRIDIDGNRVEPFFKPAWSPLLLRSMMYLGHLCIYSRKILDRAGYCDPDYDGTQDYELALRVTDLPDCRVVHVPGIFYHWRMHGYSADAENNQRCHERGKRALAASLQRREISANIESGFRPCTYAVRPKRSYPKISILIPTRNNYGYLQRCIESIRQRSSYRDYEILVIDNGSDDQTTVDYIKTANQNEQINHVLNLDVPFNHSFMNNRAAEHASGDLLLLLNDDTEVITSDWMERMAEYACIQDIGAVGALLLYSSGAVQHAGVILDTKVVARHYSADTLQDGLDRGVSQLIRDVSAVTAACLMIRRDLYRSIGGLYEVNLPTSYNDVDLCLRLVKSGYRCCMVPQARLLHHESVSRSPLDNQDPYRNLMRKRYPQEIALETIWNRHLADSKSTNHGLAFRWFN
ncbi:MAG TPA: glycosyltransferase [Gemmatales bacterium]|nr:glycosyltransferase [Gemmatales bacterium]